MKQRHHHLLSIIPVPAAIVLLFFLPPGISLYAQSAEEIVRTSQEVSNYNSAYMEARMVNSDRFGDKTIEYRAWAKGENFLMEFTSDAEYGQKILRTDDRIYHFFPDSETIFTKSKGDSIVGLVSYEDVTDESDILDNYEVELEGEETIDGAGCYKVSMEVKKRRRVAYPQQTAWIEKESWIMRRVEMFTRTGTPLKTMEIQKVEEFGGKKIATDILITDDVRPDVSSRIYIEKADLDRSINDSRFTRRELSR
ncbi:MAG: outer membrane lipoprotein-sorting protein [Spirochaetaceae bacterium]